MAPNPYAQEIAAAAEKYGIPAGFALAVARAESGISDGKTSPAGAYGIMQLMPGTAKGLGVNPRDPHQNIEGGVRLLSQLYKQYGGDWRKTAAGYNAGPGNVAKYGGIPPFAETQQYIKRIAGYMKEPGMGNGPAPAPQSARQMVAPQAQTQGIPDVLRQGMGMVFDDSPELAAMANTMPELPVPAQTVSNNRPVSPTGNSKGYGFESMFGLKRSSTDNDAPGVHVNNSYHYRPAPGGGVQAYDYGTAKNNPAVLMKAAQYALAHPEQFSEFFYDPAGKYVKNGKVIQGSIGGHSDHAHAAPRF